MNSIILDINNASSNFDNPFVRGLLCGLKNTVITKKMEQTIEKINKSNKRELWNIYLNIHYERFNLDCGAFNTITIDSFSDMSLNERRRMLILLYKNGCERVNIKDVRKVIEDAVYNNDFEKLKTSLQKFMMDANESLKREIKLSKELDYKFVIKYYQLLRMLKSS